MQQQSRGCLPVLVLLALCCCTQGGVVWRHAVIIDAGSTGSRAHVFRYHTPEPGAAFAHTAYPVVELPESVLKTTPGLSSYAHNPAAAAQSLQPLLKFAKEKVPEDRWSHTPVQLMATAGVRMLKNGSAERIVAEVERFLSASGFDFSGARVLTGTEEGLLGWVALNYASGALQAASSQRQPKYLGRKDPPASSSSSSSSSIKSPSVPLQGVLELGGGSLQVTLLPSSPPPPAEASPLTLPSLGNGRLYSRSFDGLGLQAAMSKWSKDLAARQQTQDPCLPVGFKATHRSSSSSSSRGGVHGSGNWGACKAGVSGLIPKDSPCLYKLCGLAGSFLPAIDGATFVGLDNFFYTATTLGLPTNKHTSLNDFDKAAATFCGNSWAHIRQHHLKNHRGDPTQSYHARVCFSAALIIGLLKDGLHLPTNAPLLTASNSITTPQGQSLEAKWPLGALVVGLLQSKCSGLKGTSLNPKVSGIGQTLTPKHHRTHDHAMLGAGEEAGLSAGSAAAVAALFCLSMLALSLCLSWIGVGLPGHGRCGFLWNRLWWALGRPFGASRVGAASGGGGWEGGGDGRESVRYMRVRPLSRGPRSRSASPSRRGEGGPAGAVMLTVLSATANSGPVLPVSRTVDETETRYSSTSSSGSKGSRPLTVRQR